MKNEPILSNPDPFSFKWQLDWEAPIFRSLYHTDPIKTTYHYDYFSDASFSPEGNIFAVIGENKDVCVMKIDHDGVTENAIPNRKYKCTLLQFQNPTSIIVNSDLFDNHCARNIDIKKGTFISYFPKHNQKITSMEICDTTLITSSLDKTIMLCDINTSSKIHQFTFPDTPNVALHPSKMSFVVSSPSLLAIYDIRNIENPVASINPMITASEVFPHFGPCGKNLMLISNDVLHLFHLPNLNTDFSFRFQAPYSKDSTPPNPGNGFCFSPSEDYFLVPCCPNSIIIADEKNDKEGYQLTVLRDISCPINAIRMSPLYDNMVTCGKECFVWSVDQQTYEDIYQNCRPKNPK